ncbi:MAG TPA: hypothetical protein VMV28_03790 [Thermoplasmata archaeon]|nr:hypothetical protein [Thermoplasmata archaeon]
MTNSVSIYKIRRVFRAPLPFVYAWCTDYTNADRRLQGDPGSRQIIKKTSRSALYEDLNETPHGWMWSRQTVTFQPPDRWRATAIGNYRTWNLEHCLRQLPDGRTEFTMRGERRATSLGVTNPPKTVLERELQIMWRNLGNALERSYRALRPRTSSRR